ncbi:hypothetical protein ACFZ8E_22880 [Methylobacterium sp. HMF5984]|uniref:hypothetical protein n=1 Tax=Methylobacterium sp. HMF5984 TaxID=3367370 RepID=UPI003851915D
MAGNNQCVGKHLADWTRERDYSPIIEYRNGANAGRRATVPFPLVDDACATAVLAAMDGIAKAHGAMHEAVALA